LNGQQALGYTHQVVNMEPMAERWKSFGWQTHEVDGHSTSEITNVIKALNTLDGPPHVLIAHTIFGKGVPFMENQIKWHYWPMSPEEYRLAKESIGVPL
jgi:transketolase